MSVVMSADGDRWDDHTFKTLLSFRFKSAEGDEMEFPVHFAFVDRDRSPTERLRKLLVESEEGFLPAGKIPMFFTLFTEMQSYRLLIATLHVRPTVALLQIMNDLVALGRLKKRPNWYAAAVDSDVFAASFMRSSETFFAFQNAAAVLSRREFARGSKVSRRLLLRFKLPTFTNSHELSFRFDDQPLMPKRMAVIIGKNGVGKSQSLFHLTSSLLIGGDVSDPDNKKPLLNRIVAVSTPGETATSFPKKPANPRIPYFRVRLQAKTPRRSSESLGNILIQLARSRETLGPRARWNLFVDTISRVIPLEEIHLRVKAERTHKDPAGVLRYPSDVRLGELADGGDRERLERWACINLRADPFRWAAGRACPLSSGQLTFLQFAAHSCLYVEHGTLLLVDEPETHMHPNLIRDFVTLVNYLLEQTKSLAILSTHSAYLVREVPTSQVILLEETSTHHVERRPIRLNTLGADVGAISHFVFGDELYGSLLEIIRERALESDQPPEAILAQLEPELSSEAYMFLRRELGPK